ncbi:MAG: hypothetical protein P8N19_03110 [Flavobacteriales bacterium]|nr:hypothetical protein [Flavobacteriales bacterium]
MKNLIVSYDKLSSELNEALRSTYPDGFDHKTFEFEMPTRNEIWTALRLQLKDITYIIKLEAREKNIDNLDLL